MDRAETVDGSTLTACSSVVFDDSELVLMQICSLTSVLQDPLSPTDVAQILFEI